MTRPPEPGVFDAPEEPGDEAWEYIVVADRRDYDDGFEAGQPAVAWASIHNPDREGARLLWAHDFIHPARLYFRRWDEDRWSYRELVPEPSDED